MSVRQKIVLKPKRKDLPNRLVFIDASYFIFYRFSATKVWFSKHSGKGDEEDCHLDNPEFVGYYQKQFGDWVKRIEKAFGVSSEQIFWFKDAPRESLWRNQLMDSYKESREQKDTLQIGPFFAYSFENLIDPKRLVAVPTAEADDVCAICVMEVLDRVWKLSGGEDRKLTVITGDTDYLQLKRYGDLVKIVRLPKFEEIPLVVKVGKKKEQVNALDYLISKVVMGDTSDDIPRVFNGCGPATALKIARDQELFEKMIASHPERLERFERNRTLIDFDRIPTEIKDQTLRVFWGLV